MRDKNNILLERIKGLIDTDTRENIAKAFGCDTSYITKQYNGDRTITIDYVCKYAKHFNVSTDYILGLTDVKSTNRDMRYICDFTGLLEDTVNKLHLYCTPNLDLIENSETEEIDKKFELTETQKTKKIINDLILSPVFDSAIKCDSNIEFINNDFMSYLAIFFGDYEYFYKLNTLVDNEQSVKDFKYLTERYEHQNAHNALNDEIDLTIFKFQKSILSRYENISVLNQIQSEQRTFDLIRFAVGCVVDNAIKNNEDIISLKDEINAFIGEERQEDIKKLKTIYEQLKKEV